MIKCDYPQGYNYGSVQVSKNKSTWYTTLTKVPEGKNAWFISIDEKISDKHQHIFPTKLHKVGIMNISQHIILSSWLITGNDLDLSDKELISKKNGQKSYNLHPKNLLKLNINIVNPPNRNPILN